MADTGERRRRAAMAAIAVVALALVAAAVWGAAGADDEMSSGDAREFTRRALAASGVDGASIDGRIRRDTFAGEDGAVPVWVVPARVRGERIELYVDRRGDQAVNLDDQVGPDEFVLSQEEFAALDRYRWDPLAADRRRRLLVPALSATALAVGVAGTTAVAVTRRWVALPGRSTAVI